MIDLQRKRRAIELGHLKAWPHTGRSRFHPENLRRGRAVLRVILRCGGLLGRGERNALEPVVRSLAFCLPSLPQSLCGFRILHLSDLHADEPDGFADRLCERLCDLEVDLCLLTGDYRFENSGPCQNVYRQMEKILAAVKARHGVVGILGNHDFVEEADTLRRMGVTMLLNEAVEVSNGSGSLWVIGLDDPHYYGCDDLSGALQSVPPDSFKILLVHSPELYREAADRGVDLYLCGHTHGGQICFPLVGPVWLNARAPRRVKRGRWTQEGMQGFTSAGVGTSLLPVRFLCPPEIGLIELRCQRPVEESSPRHPAS